LSGEEGLAKLFFELASEARLGILYELRKGNLRMQQIARRLDMTATEAFRQLERLGAASLVQRRPDGAFALTEYGKQVLQISATLDFISRHREYFSTHELTKLPPRFVNRLGELSGAKLEANTIETLNRGADAFTRAKRYIWGVGEGSIPEHMVPVMNEQVQSGIEVRMLISGPHFPHTENLLQVPRNVETRVLNDCPVMIALTEGDAIVTFRQVGGRADYAAFVGNDPVFHEWVRDVFLYYWEMGKRIPTR
jgi:predicted transcriptional regulator